MGKKTEFWYKFGSSIQSIEESNGCFVMTITDTQHDKEIPLPPPLDEFRKALKDEIEVAKRNSSNTAVPLSNGHKVTQLGSAFQYAFLIDSVLNTPDGAPGDLMVPGKPPLEVTIVSAEGLRLVVSVNTDLGQFIPTARLQSNLTLLMRKLIERIEKNASNENPAASRMLGKKPVQGEPKPIEKQANLNESQFKALQGALGRNLAFIWGPPGTGKTHTIGTIAECLYREKRTVLVVSHTNTAVDQAIRHVANTFKKERPDDLSKGGLLRLGEVRDEVLKSGFPDVLLITQVEKRSRELAEKRDQLISLKQALAEELNKVENEIAISEWVVNSEPDILSAQKQLQILHSKENELTLTERNLSDFSEKHSELLNLERLATQAIMLKKRLSERRNEEANLRQKLEKLSSDSTSTLARIKDQENRLETAERITPLRKELASYPPSEILTSTIANLTERMHEFDRKLATRKAEHGVAHNILEEAANTGTMMRLWKHLPKAEDQQIVVNRIRQQITNLNEERLNVQRSLEQANRTLNRTQELNAELSKYAHIGEYSLEVEKHKDALRVQVALGKDISELGSKLANLEKTISQFQKELQAYPSMLAASPESVLSNVHTELQNFSEMTEHVKTLRSEAMAERRQLTSVLAHMVECLSVWGLIDKKPDNVETMLELVRKKHSEVANRFSHVNLSMLKDKANTIRSDASRLSSEIARINEILSKIEKTIIAEASIIGATLTKAYLSDDIQARKFDTVILDEASMAPIPALWVAALLADKNLIIVGDFKQLPPIVLSNNELTKKWLGRDIFEVSGIRALWENGEPPDYFIPLTEQHRMLPQIADIANIFYDGILKTPPNSSNFSQGDLYEWYNKDWGYDNPVLLVDTGSLNAWVTSVVKNGNTSRLNFLSATVAVDIAEQLLRPDRPQRQEGAPKRIIIVSPYRAHAKLVSLLVRENKALQDDVISGTAHSFQGSEADVVIFDLVADEPHWKVNLFMPDLDDQIARLLNVSLTRAKFRLIILGDFEYCREHAKKAFLGKSLLPCLLKKFPRVDAAKLVPDGLAARAAKTQMTMLGGAIEPDSDRIVVTQADFYRILSADFERASYRIVIYSPFMTQDRIAFLLPQLEAAAIDGGVAVYIVTKSHSERSRSELQQYKKLESQLSEIGAVVIHKLRMHEKLVFIDGDITWSGSLNPLSFSNTQEIMERRKSSSVLQDYFKILRLEELLSVQEKPESRCPICGSEMIAAEGADEPYYWRCVKDDCYTRSIDQPYPLDGMLTCASCNAPVQFGDWGDYPHWRCSSNTRHRQKVFKSHLRLPKMAALVPKSERKKVCKILGIDNFESFVDNAHQRVSSNAQISLFETEPVISIKPGSLDIAKSKKGQTPETSIIPGSVTHSAKPIILDTVGDTIHSCSIVEVMTRYITRSIFTRLGHAKIRLDIYPRTPRLVRP